MYQYTQLPSTPDDYLVLGMRQLALGAAAQCPYRPAEPKGRERRKSERYFFGCYRHSLHCFTVGDNQTRMRVLLN